MFWRLAPEDVWKNSLDVRFFAVWFLRLRVRPFFSPLPPSSSPFCSWGRLGSLFFSSACVPAGLPWSKAGPTRHLHMTCRSLSSLLSLCPGRPPSSSSSLFSLSVSLSLSSCKHAFACVCVRLRALASRSCCVRGAGARACACAGVACACVRAVRACVRG